MTDSPAPSILGRLARDWNHFWFRPGDPINLGMIRICCGLVLLYVHLAYTFDLQEFFGPHAWIDLKMLNEFRYEAPTVPPASDWESPTVLQARDAEEQQFIEKWGMNPRQAQFHGRNVWSIFFHVTDPAGIRIVHAATLLVMFCFIIGLFTRVTSVLSWIALLSYIQRAPTALFGLDTMTNVVLLYLMIGPSGAALSVDRLLSRWWSVRKARRLGQPAPPLEPPAQSVSAHFALRLIQVHFCIIYLIAGLSKLEGAIWWQGTAIWGTMANYEFCPMRFQLYDDLLKFLCRHRWLWELTTTGTTYFTLVFEVSFPFLVWTRRGRWMMVVCSVMLHLGIAFFMGLATFSLMMIIGVSSFIPAEVVHTFARRWSGISFETEDKRLGIGSPEFAR